MQSSKLKITLIIALVIGCLSFSATILVAEVGSPFLVSDLPREINIPSLKTVKVPGPPEAILREFVRNKKAAIQLGKALFWETKIGSDNIVACASCHFHAGADPRIKNQLNPGMLDGDEDFEIGGPNYTLRPKDFPFRLDSNDIAGSQGVFNTLFLATSPGGNPDVCETIKDDVFHSFHNGKQINTRRNEPRNTPTVINAVFNFRNFWDGSANNIFNGIDQFGLRNQGSFIWKLVNGKLQKVRIAIPTSSLASQAAGPPLSGFEMSCKERMFFNIAQKILGLNILASQRISPSDSVLGAFSQRRPRYEALIKEAFQPELWAGGNVTEGAVPGAMDEVDRPTLGFPEVMSIPQIEMNFSLFFSLSIQLYEATLVSDNSPFDRFAEGNLQAISEQQKRGLQVFVGQGRCVNCHGGAEFTNASVGNVINERLEKMVMGNDEVAVYDNGFYNIGVRPTKEDLGVGDRDPFGNPLSETRMVQRGLARLLGNGFNPAQEPSRREIKRTAVDGAFKTPTLRNSDLTGPYFHNGGKGTLMHVVNFYNRGGDFAEENLDNLDPDIRPLGLSEKQKTDLVAFLLSLTDERVRFKRAPFDHPSLCFTHGHPGSTKRVIENGNTGNATDTIECIREVGAEGVAMGEELKPFLGLSPFDQSNDDI